MLIAGSGFLVGVLCKSLVHHNGSEIAEIMNFEVYEIFEKKLWKFKKSDGRLGIWLRSTFIFLLREDRRSCRKAQLKN